MSPMFPELLLRHFTLTAGCEVAPKEQAKDKHVARRTRARIINIIGRLLWNLWNGVAAKNREVLGGKKTSVRLTKEQVFRRQRGGKSRRVTLRYKLAS